MIVDHFGLHWQDNICFLHEQGRTGRCLSPGLARMESPFTVRAPHWLRCPHSLGEPEPGPILDHPLVRAMGPAQEGRLFCIEAVHVSWLWRLSEMCPGPERKIEPYWVARPPRQRRLAPMLNLTNVAPLGIIEWSAADFADVEALAALPRRRNLIVCGPLKLPGATLLDPAGLDWDHDWPAEGRRQLWHLIRKDV